MCLLLLFIIITVVIYYYYAYNRYNPRSYYERIPELRQCVDQIGSGYFSPEDPNLFRNIVNTLLDGDRRLSRALFRCLSLSSLAVKTSNRPK